RTLVRVVRHNRGAFVSAPGEEALEFGHDVAALGFGGLMTALAIGLEDGTDFAVITNSGSGFGCRIFVGGKSRGYGNKTRDHDTDDEGMYGKGREGDPLTLR